MSRRQAADKPDRVSRPRRAYRPPVGDLVLHPPRFVPLPPEDEQAALAALAELLAPLFRTAKADPDSGPDGAPRPIRATPPG